MTNSFAILLTKLVKVFRCFFRMELDFPYILVVLVSTDL